MKMNETKELCDRILKCLGFHRLNLCHGKFFLGYKDDMHIVYCIENKYFNRPINLFTSNFKLLRILKTSRIFVVIDWSTKMLNNRIDNPFYRSKNREEIEIKLDLTENWHE